MLERSKTIIKRLWTPNGASFDRQVVVFWRVRLVVWMIDASVLVLMPAAFLAALFLHSRILGGAGIVLLAIYMGSNAVLLASRIRLAWRLGRWIGWKREPIWPHEKPVQYWAYSALHATVLAVYAIVAVFLIWSALNWILSR